eukprot:758699-Hanusia_phi.AAC.3
MHIMQGNNSLRRRWCEYRHNSVVITGYCVQNTLAKELLDAQPATHTLQDGKEVPLKIRVHYISFSAHADFIQTSQFIDELRPSHIVLVHGEANMMASLKKQLVSKYEHMGVGVWSPQNTENVTLTFHESKVAKVVGSLAVERPKSGGNLHGVVLHKNFQLTIVGVDEMGAHAGLEVSHLIQRQSIPFHQPWDVLRFNLSKLFDSIDEVCACVLDACLDHLSFAQIKTDKEIMHVDNFSAEGANSGKNEDAGGNTGKEGKEKKKILHFKEKEFPIRILDAVTVRKVPLLLDPSCSSHLEAADGYQHDPTRVGVQSCQRPRGRLCPQRSPAGLAPLFEEFVVPDRFPQTLSNPTTNKTMIKEENCESEMVAIVKAMLEERYGSVQMVDQKSKLSDSPMLEMEVDGWEVTVDVVNQVVSCASKQSSRGSSPAYTPPPPAPAQLLET